MIAAVPLTDNETVSADPGDITVTGRLVTGFVVGSDEFTGLGGVRINIDSSEIAVTENDGTFAFTLPPGGIVTLSVPPPVILGYAVLNPSVLQIDTSSGDVNDIIVALVEVFGTINGTVTRDGSPIGGVHIYIHDRNSGDLVKRTITESDGTYSADCRTGEYTVSINNMYYEASSIDVDLGMEVVDGIDFDLIVREGTTYLFGFDLTHSMMLIGGILGLVLLIFAILYRINISKHPETSKIKSDRKKDQD
jgi:hypothetical protein